MWWCCGGFLPIIIPHQQSCFVLGCWLGCGNMPRLIRGEILFNTKFAYITFFQPTNHWGFRIFWKVENENIILHIFKSTYTGGIPKKSWITNNDQVYLKGEITGIISYQILLWVSRLNLLYLYLYLPIPLNSTEDKPKLIITNVKPNLTNLKGM